MEDFLLLEDGYQDEEKLIRDVVRRFVVEQVAPEITGYYERGEFPLKLVKKCAELGLLGMTLPESYGGQGASAIAYGLVCQELERGDSGLRSFVSVQSSLCMYPIYAFGSEVQRLRWLPGMAKGLLIGCFGLTEPDTGSNPSAMKTHAEKVEGGWRLNGSKLWITNASIADLAVVWASTKVGIRGFVVEKGASGFVQNPIKHKMSLRASDTGELVFQDCFVPDENILPGSEVGLKAPLSCLSQARYGIAWGALGAAMACFDIAVDYCKNRQQFGKPIASFQLIQKDLAEMFAEIVKIQALNIRVGQLKQANKATPTMISLAKMSATRVSLAVARVARNLLGANGISLEYDVIRHMNNLESVFTYEGTDNVHLLVLGKHITGIDAFVS